MKTLNLNCICGATCKGYLPELEARKIEEIWRENHCWYGHGGCSAETATRIRLKFEAEEAEAEKGKP